MTNNLLQVFTFAGILIFSVFPAVAQESCTLDRDLIFKMDKQEYGSYSIWNTISGDPGVDERFVSGAVIENGDLVAAGEKLSYGTNDTDLVIAEFEQRGRKLWQEVHKIAGLRSVKDILTMPKGFLVLGNRRNEKKKDVIWLGFFDEQGKLVRQKDITGAKALMAEDIIPARGTQGFFIAASLGSEPYSAVIYKVDPKGSVISRRAYRPGLENRIFGLSDTGKDFLMASGYMRGEDGRKTGWLLKLDKEGNIVWQRQYPRGAGAHLNKTVDVMDKFVMATGQSVPTGEGNRAAWVMMIDGNSGDLVWQRYYTGELNYEGRDIIVSPQRMASVLLDSRKPDKSQDPEYVRLLTVTPRGALYVGDEFFSGEGAQGARLIEGHSGERIVFGNTTSMLRTPSVPPGGPDIVKYSQDGWIFAAADAEFFDDPCIKSDSFRP